MYNWNTFGAQTYHGHTWTHKTRYNPNLGEATTFPLIILFVLNHGSCTQMSFCPRTPKLGVSKFLKLRLPRLWKFITFCAHLLLRWGLKKSCSSFSEISNDMWHTTCTQVSQSNSWFLVVGSQIDKLTIRLFFGHNLCFKYSNGMCESILDI